jgi:hypothetical protein
MSLICVVPPVINYITTLYPRQQLARKIREVSRLFASVVPQQPRIDHEKIYDVIRNTSHEVGIITKTPFSAAAATKIIIENRRTKYLKYIRVNPTTLEAINTTLIDYIMHNPRAFRKGLIYPVTSTEILYIAKCIRIRSKHLDGSALPLIHIAIRLSHYLWRSSMRTNYDVQAIYTLAFSMIMGLYRDRRVDSRRSMCMHWQAIGLPAYVYPQYMDREFVFYPMIVMAYKFVANKTSTPPFPHMLVKMGDYGLHYDDNVKLRHIKDFGEPGLLNYYGLEIQGFDWLYEH